jgi:AcrR family transcriptional regulator
MNEVKKRIIDFSDELFWKQGFRTITMDDISKNLGISKKTLYLHFKDKETLVKEVVKHRTENQESEMQLIRLTAKDPIDEILKISNYLRILLEGMHTSLLSDIQKFYPDAFKCYQEYKSKCMVDSIYQNMERGIQLGYYRENINLDVLCQMRLMQVEQAFEMYSSASHKYSIQDIQIELLEHFLYGICTMKGHKLINKYKHINDEN